VAALAAAWSRGGGCRVQALSRNPLAEPSVLGGLRGRRVSVWCSRSIFASGHDPRGPRPCRLRLCGPRWSRPPRLLIAAAGTAMFDPELLLAGVIVGIFFSSEITVVISIVRLSIVSAVSSTGCSATSRRFPRARSRSSRRWLVSASGSSSGRRASLNVLASGRRRLSSSAVGRERLKLRIFGGATLLTARRGLRRPHRIVG